MLRHIGKRMQGEQRDKESGLHLAHAVFYLLTLLTYERLQPGTNDLQLG